MKNKRNSPKKVMEIYSFLLNYAKELKGNKKSQKRNPLSSTNKFKKK